jgi:hypothetical protein
VAVVLGAETLGAVMPWILGGLDSLLRPDTHVTFAGDG